MGQGTTGRNLANPELAGALSKQTVLTAEDRWNLEVREIFMGDYVKNGDTIYIPDEELEATGPHHVGM